jgi:nucleoside-diphosphate-sugar epimerase
MRVLVTGATGFVGRAACAALADAGAEVIAAARDGRADVALDLEAGDVAGVLARFRPQAVVNCAGMAAGTDPARLMAANHAAALRLLAAAEAVGAARAVLIGSAAAYAPMRPGQAAIAEDHPLAPISAYGQSKASLHRLGAAWTARGRMAVLTAVPFNLFGPGQPARQAPQAFVAQLRGPPATITVGDLSAVRDWVDVRDAARALALLATGDAPSGPYNVATGRGRATGELLDRLCVLTGLAPRRIADPAVQARPTLPASIGDPARLSACGWRPRLTLEQTLRDMLAAA